MTAASRLVAYVLKTKVSTLILTSVVILLLIYTTFMNNLMTNLVSDENEISSTTPSVRTKDKEKSENIHDYLSSDTDTKELPPPSQIKFIFGHSCGHAGSTSTHYEITKQTECSWGNNFVERYEEIIPEEKMFSYEENQFPQCWLTQEKIIPYLESIVKKEIEEGKREFAPGDEVTYIDLGHFHNRGHTMECLAYLLGERATLIHIGRNRYDIARSFTKISQTPCITDPQNDEIMKELLQNPTEEMIRRQKMGRGPPKAYIHPHVSRCPRSGEGAGPVDLPISDDDVWDHEFTPYQRFLWLADELTHRWHNIKLFYETKSLKELPNGKPKLLEMRWSLSSDFNREINKVKAELGCPLEKNDKIPVVISPNHHIDHAPGSTECRKQIEEDMAYRKSMRYNEKTSDILFGVSNPQHVDSTDCKESPEELRGDIEKLHEKFGMMYNENEWVLPVNITLNNDP